jgi:hypothetical protein
MDKKISKNGLKLLPRMSLGKWTRKNGQDKNWNAAGVGS